jgi:Competence protein CoiA-like family
LDLIDDVRCPSCSRPLVLRSGPAITAHFAHRPRQSCRNRPGRGPITPLRLEQLTLFELEPLPPATVSAFYRTPEPAEAFPARMRPPARSRRRRRAWLPRLLRWFKAQAAGG